MGLHFRRVFLVSAALSSMAGSALLADQLKATATAAITGVVVDGSSGDPVAGAVVLLSAVPPRAISSQTRQVTDEKGRFAFVNLPGDTNYNIAATAIGYLDGGFGRDATPTDPLRAIPLRSNEWLPNIKVPIWKPGGISGTVRDETGEPVVGIVVRALQRVRIQGREDFVAGPLTRTDDRGNYRLSNLTPSRYVIHVPSVQAAMPASTKIEPPPAGAPIRAIVDDSNLSVMDVDETARLVIGRYPLPPPPQGGRQFSYPAMFYPSAQTVAESATITLKFGEDFTRADVTLKPIASVRVSGIVEGPPEAMGALSLRLLPPGLENVGFGAEVATALVGAGGQFTFLNVPAGTYTIDAPTSVTELTASTNYGIGPTRALAAPPTTPVHGASATENELVPGSILVNSAYRMSGGRGYTGRQPVTVGTTDVAGVVVRLRAPVTVNGQVVVETDQTRPGAQPPARFTIQLDPAGAEAPLTRSILAGRGGGAGATQPLVFPNVTPARYLLHLVETPGWVVRSVVLGGRDYTDQPIDLTTVDASGVVVTVTNAAPALTGIVRDADGLKADATMVIAFPTDAALWRNTGFWPARMKRAVLSSARQFQFTSLPAGDYYVAAISRSFTDTWRDPEFLERLTSQASRVTLRWSSVSTVDLQPVVVR